ncbi:MBL fold metallo-hydrolase [Dyella psychrodurans]|uniref:MBL fold metallo-hydrolase n=1 Tax=Dyella psychrodurans TaxID=1927960 RepID=A0A370WZD5_9GAMM|nr:MBL fold metallo-hydrolase [Dyella psychrodurans]RDS81381.1 MBL fold metallo-hydrolase [Dyella psychrodurans]
MSKFSFCAALLMFAATGSIAAPVASPLELVVLGSGGPGATGRAGAGYVVLVDGNPRILVDAGPGTFVRLGEAKLSLANIDTVLLTHLHVDHTGELPGFFKARAVSGDGPVNVRVFGPTGHRGEGDEATFPSTSRFIDLLFGPDGAYSYLHDFAAPVTINATNIDASANAPKTPKVIYSEQGLDISAIAGHHGDAPAVIYRIDYHHQSITFSGDIDAKGIDNLRRIAQHTSLLVFNCVVLDPPGSRPVLYTLHTPPKTIGAVAADSETKKLLLSHLSPVIDQQQASVEASIREHYKGPVVFAQDGMRLQP